MLIKEVLASIGHLSNLPEIASIGFVHQFYKTQALGKHLFCSKLKNWEISQTLKIKNYVYNTLHLFAKSILDAWQKSAKLDLDQNVKIEKLRSGQHPAFTKTETAAQGVNVKNEFSFISKNSN